MSFPGTLLRQKVLYLARVYALSGERRCDEKIAYVIPIGLDSVNPQITLLDRFVSGVRLFVCRNGKRTLAICVMHRRFFI
jgi:hypothetical protein